MKNEVRKNKFCVKCSKRHETLIFSLVNMNVFLVFLGKSTDNFASSPPHLEPEITITASNSASSSKKGNLPVLHIPEYIPASFGGSVHKKTKKQALLTTPSVASTTPSGHPGMPNGLLRLSTSLQPRAGTTVTPKDQNAKIGTNQCYQLLPNVYSRKLQILRAFFLFENLISRNY